MEIVKGTVGVYTPDLVEFKEFKVTIFGQKEEVKAIYCTPHHARYNSGMYAPPEPFSQVLLAYDGRDYYYLSTIVDYPKEYGKIAKDKAGQPLPLYSEKKVFNASGSPQSVFFRDSTGAGLKVTNYRSPKEKIVSRTELRSTEGHQLVLSDSPEQDCVMLRNKNGAGIVINSKRNFLHSDNSISIFSQNSHRCVVDNGEIRLRITAGRDITLVNESGPGSAFIAAARNADPGSALAAASVVASNQWGNVNLISRWKGVNIYTGPDTAAGPDVGLGGDILMSTLNPISVVQINSMGNVKIFSNTGSVTIEGTAGLNLHSIGPIKIQSETSVDMQAPLINLNAGQIFGAYAGASCNIGVAGVPLNLNSPGNIPIISPINPLNLVRTVNPYGR
jgi:hypothetical protein